jgi:hypothetical protein
MKLTIILAILLVLIGGCSKVQDQPSGPTINTTDTISGTQDLTLNEDDLQELGMRVGTDCVTEEDYSNIIDSTIGQYSFCNYSINSLNDTEVLLQLQRFADYEALNGSYQYDSSHYYSIEGLISENDFGDQSRFRVNNVNDYGGEFNKPGVYYYHLWICKDLYLIHITSGGTSKEAKEHITQIGRQILSKFE